MTVAVVLGVAMALTYALLNGVNDAAALAEARDTIEDVYEPYLLQQGFLGRTPRGRVATRKAYEHLGVPFRGDATQGSLF